MTMRATWDQLRGRGVGDRPSGATHPDRAPWSRWVERGEEALTFFLTFVALVAVITSVERADWVPEMPALGTTALVGLVSGWFFARTRITGTLLHPIGIAIGIAWVLYTVMGSMRLAPGQPDGLFGRWSELWARNGAWLQAVRDGGFSTDPLPFVVMVVFAAWLLAYLAAWAIARWRNPWLALIPGAIALLTNISYLPGQPAAELVVFLFASILLFARVHLLKAVEEWGSNDAQPPLLSLEVLNLATWVGLGLIIAAWTIPTANNWGPFARVWSAVISPATDRVDRIGQLFIGVGAKESLGLYRFGDVLPLQGSITLGSSPLLTVESEAGDFYLVGAVYDQYSQNGWRLGPTTERPLAPTTVEAAALGSQQTRTQFKQPVRTKVTMAEALVRRRLFTPGDPLAASVGARAVVGGASEDILALAPVAEVGKDSAYETVGTITGASIDRLLTASTDYPQWVRDRYLQLPAELPPDVTALARQIAAGERVPYKVATRVEDYLRRNYSYSLEAGQRPQRQDAVHYFLFNSKRGYADYFASSMAVMLRSLGVPSRVAVGFAVDEITRDPASLAFTVSDQASWAWTQVYFPGYGWVDFNPTPSRALVDRVGAQEEVAGPAEVELDPAPFADEAPLEEEVTLDDAANVAVEEDSLARRIATTALTWVLFGSVAFLVLLGSGRMAWNTAYRQFAPATKRWAKLQTFARWADATPRGSQTPLEEATSLNSALQRPPLDLSPLAKAYVAERYGRRDSSTETAEASQDLETLYGQARSRLLKRAVRRFFGLRIRR